MRTGGRQQRGTCGRLLAAEGQVLIASAGSGPSNAHQAGRLHVAQHKGAPKLQAAERRSCSMLGGRKVQLFGAWQARHSRPNSSCTLGSASHSKHGKGWLGLRSQAAHLAVEAARGVREADVHLHAKRIETPLGCWSRVAGCAGMLQRGAAQTTGTAASKQPGAAFDV